MTKQIKINEEAYLEFSDEELKELGMEKGDKFSIEYLDGGGILLRPFETIEIDLSSFTKEELISIIQKSEEKDQTFGDTIVEILTYAIKDFEEFGF